MLIGNNGIFAGDGKSLGREIIWLNWGELMGQCILRDRGERVTQVQKSSVFKKIVQFFSDKSEHYSQWCAWLEFHLLNSKNRKNWEFFILEESFPSLLLILKFHFEFKIWYYLEILEGEIYFIYKPKRVEFLSYILSFI